MDLVRFLYHRLFLVFFTINYLNKRIKLSFWIKAHDFKYIYGQIFSLNQFNIIASQEKF